MNINEKQPKMVDEIMKSANNGNAEALFKMGIIYERGFLKTHAFQLLKKAIAETETDIFSHYYIYDYKNSFKCYLKAAELGHINSQIKVAIYYYNHWVDEEYIKVMDKIGSWDYKLKHEQSFQEHYKQALSWLKKATEQGSPNAVIFMAEIEHSIFHNTDLAYELFKQVLEQLDATQIYEIGIFYKTHVGNFSNREYEFYAIAADKGNIEAQKLLALEYTCGGVCIKEDLHKAFHYYNLAAEQGDHYAEYEVGSCYYYGKGVEKNITKANEWLMKAYEFYKTDSDELTRELIFNLLLSIEPRRFYKHLFEDEDN